jgi:hypothetical protein
LGYCSAVYSSAVCDKSHERASCQSKKDIAGYQYGITQRISNMNIHLGFQLDIMDKTRIFWLNITADSFPGYRTWIIKDLPG